MGIGTPRRNSHVGFPMVKIPVEQMAETWEATWFNFWLFGVQRCLGNFGGGLMCDFY